MEKEIRHVMNDVVKENTLSQTISWLRFPLIVGIVYLHTFILNRPVGEHVITAENAPIFVIFEHVTKADIGEIAVPLFFFISGFLFFYNVNVFNKQVYVRKLKSRFRTLVIPYFVWNTLFLLYVAFLGWVLPSLLTFKKSFLTMEPLDVMNTYWDLSQGLIPLWFIRDLIVINLFSWFIYWIIKPQYSAILLFLLGLVFLSSKWHYIPGIGLRSSFPYMLGAWFSIKKCNFIDLFYKYRYVLLTLFVLLVLGDTLLWMSGNSNFSVNRLCLLCGLITIPLLVAEGLIRGQIHLQKWKEESSFFVYVFHMFIVHLPFVLLARIIPLNDFTATILQMAIPIMVAYICVMIYWIMRKTMPTMMKIAVGGR